MLCFLNYKDLLDPKIVKKASDLMDAYGIDYKNNTTLLGTGAYKQVHRTNITGVVMMITPFFEQFEQEIAILDIMNIEGFPVMKYHCVEKIGNTTFALTDLLFPADMDWSDDRLTSVQTKVQNYLEQILDLGVFFDDLQFMVDVNDNPVFIDPLDMWCTDKNRGSTIRFYAYCKDSKYTLSVMVKRKIVWAL